MNLTQQEKRVGGTSANSGIAVFSSTRKTLYVNQGAQRLLRRVNRQDLPASSNEAIPSAVDALLDEMLPMLQMAVLNHGWMDLKARRLIAAQDRSVLVKAYGIPDRADVHQSVVVVTIQEIGQV